MSNDKKLFPLQIDSGLGFDFACYSYYVGRCFTCAPESPVDTFDGLSLKNYVEKKQLHLLDLESYLNKGCITNSSSCSLL
ncbi:TPA: hypothetical protein ACG3NC_000433 [Legionella pneumophila]